MSNNFNDTTVWFILEMRNEPVKFVRRALSWQDYKFRFREQTEYKIQRCGGSADVWFDTENGFLSVASGSDFYVYRATSDEIEAIRSAIESM